MGRLARRQADGSADLRSERQHRGQRARAHHRPASRRADRARADGVRPSLLAFRRMVLARRRAGRGDSLLPGPPAAGEARADPDARGRGRHAGVVPEDPPPRSRARHRQRLPAEEPAAPPACLRPVVHAVSGLLHAQAVQQKLRPAPRQLVRAEPSRRGLRRDVRRVADARLRLAHALRRLASAQRSCSTWKR